MGSVVGIRLKPYVLLFCDLNRVVWCGLVACPRTPPERHYRERQQTPTPGYLFLHSHVENTSAHIFRTSEPFLVVCFVIFLVPSFLVAYFPSCRTTLADMLFRIGSCERKNFSLSKTSYRKHQTVISMDDHSLLYSIKSCGIGGPMLCPENSGLHLVL